MWLRRICQILSLSAFLLLIGLPAFKRNILLTTSITNVQWGNRASAQGVFGRQPVCLLKAQR